MKQIMNQPLISVIIPVYNGEPYLAETIESVLAQSYQPIEVMIIDGGSQDGSAAIAQGYHSVRYFLQPDHSAAEGRNHGVALAQGEYLAFLEADDLWAADKLERQMMVLAREPDVDAVFGHGVQFYSPELVDQLTGKINCLKSPIPTYHPNTMLIRRAAFWRVGLFNPGWQIADSLEWCVRAKQTGLRSLMLSEVVYRKRVHRTNQGLTKSRYRQEYARVLKAALDHQRQQAAWNRSAAQ